MQLAQQLSMAYDAIRQQSDALETFSQARTDPLTGVGNGRALEEKLDILLTAARRSGTEFSIALVSIDRDSSATTSDREPKGKTQLPELARLIQSCMRESDYVARYGDDEFVVVMPQTKLAGACIFGERLRGGSSSGCRLRSAAASPSTRRATTKSRCWAEQTPRSTVPRRPAETVNLSTRAHNFASIAPAARLGRRMLHCRQPSCRRSRPSTRRPATWSRPPSQQFQRVDAAWSAISRHPAVSGPSRRVELTPGKGLSYDQRRCCQASLIGRRRGRRRGRAEERSARCRYLKLRPRVTS